MTTLLHISASPRGERPPNRWPSRRRSWTRTAETHPDVRHPDLGPVGRHAAGVRAGRSAAKMAVFAGADPEGDRGRSLAGGADSRSSGSPRPTRTCSASRCGTPAFRTSSSSSSTWSASPGWSSGSTRNWVTPDCSTGRRPPSSTPAPSTGPDGRRPSARTSRRLPAGLAELGRDRRHHRGGVPAQPGHRRRRDRSAGRARRSQGRRQDILTGGPAGAVSRGRRPNPASRRTGRPARSRQPPRRRTAALVPAGWDPGVTAALIRLPSGLAVPSASIVSASPRSQRCIDQQFDAEFELLAVDRFRARQQAPVQTVQQVGVLRTGQHGGVAIGDGLADLRPDRQATPGRACGSVSIR